MLVYAGLCLYENCLQKLSSFSSISSKPLREIVLEELQAIQNNIIINAAARLAKQIKSCGVVTIFFFPEAHIPGVQNWVSSHVWELAAFSSADVVASTSMNSAEVLL